MPDIFLYAGEVSPNDVRLSDPTQLRGGTPPGLIYVEALRPATLFPGSGPNPLARLRPSQGGERLEAVLPPETLPSLNQVILIGQGWYLPITDGPQVRLTRGAGWVITH